MAVASTKWEDWASFVLGLWLAVSPWIAGYAEHELATGHAIVVGLVLALGSHFECVACDEFPMEWLNLAVGVWLVCAPFTLEFGSRVAMANSIAVGGKLGGHLVTGHVDGVGEVAKRAGSVVAFRAPKALARYVAAKGSICIDGVSLTVNKVDGEVFEVNLIPHTLEVTTLARLAPGARVNLEVDLIARYVERMLAER
jgi:hypothetical protein